jgi:hypothetical protein
LALELRLEMERTKFRYTNSFVSAFCRRFKRHVKEKAADIFKERLPGNSKVVVGGGGGTL